MGVGSLRKRLLRHKLLVIFAFPEGAVGSCSKHLRKITGSNPWWSPTLINLNLFSLPPNPSAIPHEESKIG